MAGASGVAGVLDGLGDVRAVVLMLHQVHTVVGPRKTYGSYPDPLVAQRMRDHLAGVLHTELVVEPVEEPEPVTVYRIVATRRGRTLDAGRSDPVDLDAAMRIWQAALPGWKVRAIAETFVGSATKTPSRRVGNGAAAGPTVPTVPIEEM